MLKETASSPTSSVIAKSRGGGPDDTRVDGDVPESPTKTELPNTPRGGGPDDTRSTNDGSKGAPSEQLPNTPRGGMGDSRG